MFYRVIGAGGIAVAGAAYGGYQISKNYPAEGKIYQPGDLVLYNGETKRVIGYFGAGNEVFEKGVDFKRGLYYADKKTAQGYARNRAGNHSIPQTVVILADYLPGRGDHDMGAFELFEPLSRRYLKNAHVILAERENVTLDNRLGILACFRRMQHSFKPRS